MAVDKERKQTYLKKLSDITQKDILSLAFRFSGAQINEMTNKADKVITKLIQNNGELPIKEFMEAAGYDYNNPQQKYMCKRKFIMPLFNTGLIWYDNDSQDEDEIVRVELDSFRFGCLMDNFKKKWEKLSYAQKKK